MGAHLRANVMLLVLTVVLCCVIYPAILWVIGQTVFPDQAAGSLIYKADGKTPVGSRLIGQPFSDDRYFWPRPSSAGYDASASGGSNLAASNPKLRGRIAQQLGPIVRYRNGKQVGDDVEAWYQEKAKRGSDRDLTAEWVNEFPTLVKVWAASSDQVKAYIKDWAEKHPEVMAAWKAKNADATSPPEAADLAPFFFDSYLKVHPRTWPCVVDVEVQGKKEKQVKPDTKGSDVQSTFFDMWLREHPKEATEIDPVPADMVMSSGSGLDPHITLRNAEYQAPRVAKAREGKLTLEQIKALASKMSFRPLGGIAGDEPLVNVLELNLALDAQ